MQHEPRNILILGANYTGKTYAAGFAAANVSRDLVVIVHTHPDASYLDHIGRNRTRFVEATSSGYSITPQLLEETRKGASERYKRYLYVTVKDLAPSDQRAFLDRLARAAMTAGNLALFIDEASVLCTRMTIPESFHRLVRGARHYGLDLTLVTHRVYDIDPGVRCVLTDLVLFRIVEPRDLDVLARHLDLGSRAERIATLADRHFLMVNRRRDSVTGPYVL